MIFWSSEVREQLRLGIVKNDFKVGPNTNTFTSIQVPEQHFVTRRNLVFFIHASIQPITRTIKSWHNKQVACLLADRCWWDYLLRFGNVVFNDTTFFWYSIVTRQFVWCHTSIKGLVPIEMFCPQSTETNTELSSKKKTVGMIGAINPRIKLPYTVFVYF